MAERLSIAEIERRHDGEWVLLVDIEEDADGETTSGVVAAHSEDRDEVYGAVSELERPILVQTLCFRKMPEGWGLSR